MHTIGTPFNPRNGSSLKIRSLYRLLTEAGAEPTEIDFAFFVDLAMHISISRSRINQAKAALNLAKRDHDLSPAQRRQAISRVLVPRSQRKDRMGRNVVYFIDGIGIGGLSDEEKEAWRVRSGRKASQCGLSDERPFLPYSR